MIKIRKYNSVVDAEIWDAFVDASKNGTFMLKRGYMDYHADRFEDYSLMFFNDDKLVAILPASIHGKELRSHGGLTYGGMIIGCNMTVQLELHLFEELTQYLKKQSFANLIYKRVPAIYYRYPSDEDLYALYRVGAQLTRRDMSSTIYMPDKIKFSERRRRGSKQALKHGIEVRKTDDYDGYILMLNDILEKYHNTKPVHSADELKLLANKFPNNIKLFAAYLEDKMMAGVVIYETNQVAHAQYIANSDQGRQCGALDAVMDYLINTQYVNKDYFDFGISTENEGLLLNEGLVTQKQEFGARGIVYDFYELKI
jgi:hypothetical protein